MPEHSFRCHCGQVSRYLFSQEQHPYPDVAPCQRCGGGATRFFERAPGMQPDSFWSGKFDIQAGRTFHSRRERDEYLRSKDLHIISDKEFDRTILPKEHPDEIEFDSVRWHEAAAKAHNDIFYGNVEVPPPPSLDDADQPIISVGKE